MGHCRACETGRGVWLISSLPSSNRLLSSAQIPRIPVAASTPTHGAILLTLPIHPIQWGGLQGAGDATQATVTVHFRPSLPRSSLQVKITCDGTPQEWHWAFLCNPGYKFADTKSTQCVTPKDSTPGYVYINNHYDSTCGARSWTRPNIVAAVECELGVDASFFALSQRMRKLS